MNTRQFARSLVAAGFQREASRVGGPRFVREGPRGPQYIARDSVRGGAWRLFLAVGDVPEFWPAADLRVEHDFMQAESPDFEYFNDLDPSDPLDAQCDDSEAALAKLFDWLTTAGFRWLSDPDALEDSEWRQGYNLLVQRHHASRPGLLHFADHCPAAFSFLVERFGFEGPELEHHGPAITVRYRKEPYIVEVTMEAGARPGVELFHPAAGTGEAIVPYASRDGVPRARTFVMPHTNDAPPWPEQEREYLESLARHLLETEGDRLERASGVARPRSSSKAARAKRVVFGLLVLAVTVIVLQYAPIRAWVTENPGAFTWLLVAALGLYVGWVFFRDRHARPSPDR